MAVTRHSGLILTIHMGGKDMTYATTAQHDHLTTNIPNTYLQLKWVSKLALS